MVATTIDREGIAATYVVIRPYTRVTPVVEVNGADFGLSRFTLLLKLEQLQHSGSFKARGAFANLLMRAILEAGVVAASDGYQVVLKPGTVLTFTTSEVVAVRY